MAATNWAKVFTVEDNWSKALARVRVPSGLYLSGLNRVEADWLEIRKFTVWVLTGKSKPSTLNLKSIVWINLSSVPPIALRRYNKLHLKECERSS